MKPPEFAYHSAATIDEAVALLASLGEDAKLLAGGQSLGPMLNFRLARPSHLIDIRRVETLRAAAPADTSTNGVSSGGLSLGAAITHAAIEDGRIPALSASPLAAFLARVARGIAYRAVRNRGTLGGSLAQADPAADWPVVMSALDASLHLVSATGGRSVAARAFFKDHLETVLRPDELLHRIDIPAPAPGAVFGFAKTVRKAGEFAESLAVAVLRLDAEDRIAAADLWLGAAAATPIALKPAEALLAGRRWSADLAAELRAAVAAALPAPETPQGRYKLNLHGVNLVRAIAEALGRREAA